ncbi:MAG TPA: hypothetical protein VJM31_00010 [Vicinamibacterales bacterium]|nr:hypothetical protein [Vicinamibacterales bacterium]
MSELESFLKGSPAETAPVVEAPKVEVQTEAETPPDRPRDESGRFVPKGDEPKPEAAKVEAAPPAAKEAKPKAPEVTGLEAGIAAERNKRQDAERRVAEYEARLRALEAKANPPQPPPDPISDPQGFAQTFEQKLQLMEINHRVNTSAAIARMKHADFDQALQDWNGLIAQDQSLYMQAIQQADPAEWAYQHVKRQQLLREVGDDPASYRQKLEAEIRQKLEAEYAQRAPAPPVVPAPPPSLASARSNGRMSEPVWSGPPPLSDIFKR